MACRMIARLLFCLLCLLAALPAQAEEQRRVALVLGNAGYAALPPLANAVNDGKAIANRLNEMGFEVVSGFDLTKADTQATMAKFAKDGAWR